MAAFHSAHLAAFDRPLTAILLDVRERHPVHPRHAAVVAALLVGLPEHVLSMHFVVERVETELGRFLRFRVERRLQLLNLW